MIEAMACGTPVIAFRCGSVPEVIEHGVTGFVVDSVEEAVEAVRRARPRSTARPCRRRFEERFTAERMARDYVRALRAAAGGRRRRPPIRRRPERAASDTRMVAQADRRRARLAILHRRPPSRSPSGGCGRCKHDDTFAVFDRIGDIAARARARPRASIRRTRASLAASSLLLGGAPPAAAELDRARRQRVLSVDLTNPDLQDADGKVGAAAREPCTSPRRASSGDERLLERLALRNFGAGRSRSRSTCRSPPTSPTCSRCAASAASGAASSSRPRSRRRRGACSPTAASTASSAAHAARASSRRRPRSTDARRRFELDGSSRASATVLIAIACGDRRRRCEPAALRRAYAGADATPRSAARVAADAPSRDLERPASTMARARSRRRPRHADHRHAATGPYPYAGVPWFSTAFGRDGIITALRDAVARPRHRARRARASSPRRRRRESTPRRDAEPGKILHEMRGGEMARSARCRSAATTAASTRRRCSSCSPAPTSSAPATCDRSRELWPNVEARAATGSTRYGDRDGDGFVEYARQTDARAGQPGLEGLARLDLPRRRHAGRGRRSRCARCRPTSTRAKRGGRRARARARRRRRAAERWTRRRDDAARSASSAAFWCEELGTYALALDGDKRPCRVRTSNAGHALFDRHRRARARAARVARRLLTADVLLAAGASARSRPARRATTRCPTTTARSGRTTTR